MKAKRWLKVGGIRYQIIRKKAIVEEDKGLAGQVRYEEGKILIKATRDKQYEMETLLHEVFHIILLQSAFNNAVGEPVREDFIEALAQWWLQVLRDNPWLGEEILALD